MTISKLNAEGVEVCVYQFLGNSMHDDTTFFWNIIRSMQNSWISYM